MSFCCCIHKAYRDVALQVYPACIRKPNGLCTSRFLSNQNPQRLLRQKEKSTALIWDKNTHWVGTGLLFSLAHFLDTLHLHLNTFSDESWRSGELWESYAQFGTSCKLLPTQTLKKDDEVTPSKSFTHFELTKKKRFLTKFGFTHFLDSFFSRSSPSSFEARVAGERKGS